MITVLNWSAFYERHATSLQEFLCQDNFSELVETGSITYESLGKVYVISLSVAQES